MKNKDLVIYLGTVIGLLAIGILFFSMTQKPDINVRFIGDEVYYTDTIDYEYVKIEPYDDYCKIEYKVGDEIFVEIIERE